MTVQVRYMEELRILRDLPHSPEANPGREDEPIFTDSVKAENFLLELRSRHGRTTFGHYLIQDRTFIIPAGTTAEYEGAFNAFNKVWSIQFPAVETWAVQSTLGDFHNLEEYEMARDIILPLKRRVQMLLGRWYTDSDVRAQQELARLRSNAKLQEALA